MRRLDQLLRLDAGLSKRLRVAEKPGPLHNLGSLLAHSGDSWFWLAGLVLVLLAGSSDWKSRAIFWLLSILVTAALTMAVKFTIRRQRPAGEWGEMYRSVDPHSFPSGHAARAMMLAVVTLGIGPGWLGLVLLAWAPLVALARVAMGVHYLSDVLAGGLLGAITGLALLRILAPLFF